MFGKNMFNIRGAIYNLCFEKVDENMLSTSSKYCDNDK